VRISSGRRAVLRLPRMNSRAEACGKRCAKRELVRRREQAVRPRHRPPGKRYKDCRRWWPRSGLHRAHFPRCGFQAVKSAGREAARTSLTWSERQKQYAQRELNAPDFGQPGNIQHRAGQGPIAKRREDVGAAGKDRGTRVCKNVESILKRIRPKVQKRWSPNEAATMRHSTSTTPGEFVKLSGLYPGSEEMLWQTTRAWPLPTIA